MGHFENRLSYKPHIFFPKNIKKFHRFSSKLGSKIIWIFFTPLQHAHITTVFRHCANDAKTSVIKHSLNKQVLCGLKWLGMWWFLKFQFIHELPCKYLSLRYLQQSLCTCIILITSNQSCLLIIIWTRKPIAWHDQGPSHAHSTPNTFAKI